MARVAAAVDELAAAMGPADFAYFDSLVRRYVLTPHSAGPGEATPPAASAIPEGNAVGRYSAPPNSVRRDEASGSCGGGSCPQPTSEDESNNYLNQSRPANSGQVGGLFAGVLSPYTAKYQGHTVSETLSQAFDSCTFQRSRYNLNGKLPPASVPWAVQILQILPNYNTAAVYGNDSISVSTDVLDYYFSAISMGLQDDGCEIGVWQVMNIDCSATSWPPVAPGWWAYNMLYYQSAEVFAYKNNGTVETGYQNNQVKVP